MNHVGLVRHAGTTVGVASGDRDGRIHAREPWHFRCARMRLDIVQNEERDLIARPLSELLRFLRQDLAPP
jgi:hypothetical protein